MILEIDTRSPVPPYEQVREQVAALIEAGVLPPGTKLPTIRQLAGDLGLATGTVARAYRELEAAGTVNSHGRRGTTVADSAASSPRSGVLDAARRYAADARELGAHLDDAIAAVRAAYAMEIEP